jgi:hypothetical protein
MTDFRSLCAELEEAYAWCIDEYMTAPAEKDALIQRARAALAQPEPEGPTQPIPVSERLPGPEDCDAEGRCWIYMPDIGTAPTWWLVDPCDIGPYHTHWLPAHALPVPGD